MRWSSFGLSLFLLGCATSAPSEPPSLAYGIERTSTAWIEIPMGKVPVDQGVEWQGVKVYLSLLDFLIAVDASTGRVLWSEMVGAFWNRIGFKEVEVAPSSRVWAVELRPRATERSGADLVQYHDLRTGKVLALDAGSAVPGTILSSRKEWQGSESRIAEGFGLIVSTPTNWKVLLARMFDGISSGPEVEPVDFDRESILVLSDGESINCRGISVSEIREEAARIRVRVRHHYYQTFRLASDPPKDDSPLDRPYGLFVLPRFDKPLVIEYNVQRYIGGPPIWKEHLRLPPPGDPNRELDPLPRNR